MGYGIFCLICSFINFDEDNAMVIDIIILVIIIKITLIIRYK
jgi:hypothetical protein